MSRVAVLLNGCNGTMGQVFSRVALRHGDISIAAGLDIAAAGGGAATGAANAGGATAAGAATGAAGAASVAVGGQVAGDAGLAGGAASSSAGGSPVAGGGQAAGGGAVASGGAYPVYISSGAGSSDAGSSDGGSLSGGGSGGGGSGALAEVAVSEPYDVILDFSSPSALSSMLGRALSKKTPLVLAATGYTELQAGEIRDAARHIPIFWTANLSVGVNLMAELAKTAARAIGGSFDIELVEKHHRQKADAPSGTALMIADAINGELGGDMAYVHGRRSKSEKRGKKEIGVHAVRGGTIVGEHTVIFAGNDEVLEIRHVASSKEIFAEGAVRAIRFIADPARAAGLYGMGDALREGR